MASVLDSSDEKTNGFKLMRLIVDGGTEALRQTLTKHCPGNLQVVLSTHHHTFRNSKLVRLSIKTNGINYILLPKLIILISRYYAFF